LKNQAFVVALASAERQAKSPPPPGPPDAAPEGPSQLVNSEPPNLAKLNQQIEELEVRFKLRRPPPDTKVQPIDQALSSQLVKTYLNQLDQMETGFKAAGRLNSDLQSRLESLRRRIRSWQ
jgi:hypothetical protein